MAENQQTARGFNQIQSDYSKLLYAGQTYEDQAFVCTHPDMISLVANDEEGKFDSGVLVGRGVGTVVHGPFSVYAALESIRIGPKCMFNPALEAYAGSSAQAPIPTLWPKPPFEIDTDKLGSAVDRAISIVRGSTTAGSAVGSVGGSNPANAVTVTDLPPVPKDSSKCIEGLKKFYMNKRGWTEADVNKAIQIGTKLSGGKFPEVLLGIIYVESNGKSTAANPHKAKDGSPMAVGLIQWTQVAIDQQNRKHGLGLSKSKILQSGVSQQLDWAAYYFQDTGGGKSIDTYGKAYACCYLPIMLNGFEPMPGMKNSRGQLLNYYELNTGLDYNKDGKISLTDLDNVIRSRISQFGC